MYRHVCPCTEMLMILDYTTARSIFVLACEQDHLADAKFICEVFMLTREDVFDLRDNAVSYAIYNNSLKVAWWIHKTFSIKQDSIHFEDTFQELCRRGHLKMAKWLATNFKIHPGIHISAFRRACAKGYLDITQWIYETYSLNHKKVRTKCRSAFYFAQIMGHTDMCMWMTFTFGFN